MYSTANLSDVELKDQGNRFFSTRKYEDAINCYTKAIVSSVSPPLINLHSIGKTITVIDKESIESYILYESCVMLS